MRTPRASSRKASVAEQVLQQGVTHLQCTPSMAAMLLADAPGRAALSQLKALMVGGEALPLSVAIGVDEIQADDEPVDVMARADAAMYSQKS